MEKGKGKALAAKAARSRYSGGRETDTEKDELEGSGDDSEEYHAPEESEDEEEDGEVEEDEEDEEDEEVEDGGDGEDGEGGGEGGVVDEAMAGPEDDNLVVSVIFLLLPY